MMQALMTKKKYGLMIFGLILLVSIFSFFNTDDTKIDIFAGNIEEEILEESQEDIGPEKINDLEGPTDMIGLLESRDSVFPIFMVVFSMAMVGSIIFVIMGAMRGSRFR